MTLDPKEKNMWRRMKWWRVLRGNWTRGTLCGLLLTALGAAAVLAAKPPPPPPPAPGLIYFRYPDVFDGDPNYDGQIRTMNAVDGSGKTPVTPKNISGQPSHKWYADPITGEPYRWFLRVAKTFRDFEPGGPGPDEAIDPELAVFRTVANGEPAAEQFVLTNISHRTVPIENSTGIFPHYDNGAPNPQFPNDGSDAYIWFVGNNVDTGVWGIYRIPFAVDPDTGVPSANEAMLELVVPVPPGGAAFSAHGDTLAYQVTGGIAVYEIGAGTTLYSVSGSDLQWSPDGMDIAFSDGTKLKVLDTETAQVTTVYTTPRKLFIANVLRPFWSPDGNHLCFQQHVRNGDGTRRDDVLRIQASGGTAVTLTKDLATGSSPVAWRNLP
jgi:hypothetical protein